MHDSLGHEVPNGFVYNADVRIHEVADGFHLPLQLRVHRECVCRDVFILHLTKRQCINVTSAMHYFPEGTTKAFVHFIPGPSQDRLQP